MTEADSVHSTPPLNSSANIIDLSAARAAANSPAAFPTENAAEVLTLPGRLDTEEKLDGASAIMRAAVTYTSINGAINGAWRAEHTGNSTIVEIVIEGMCERRNAVLRKLTRLMKKTSAVRTVELWSLASLADVVMDQSGDEESGRNLEAFEIAFLRSLFRLIERDCESRGANSMSNIIELSPDRPAADADKTHAKAFRNLEGDVCDLDRMGEIAFDLIQQCSTHGDESSQHAFELAAFAVSQFSSMANAFRENYYAAHSGEEWPQCAVAECTESATGSG